MADKYNVIFKDNVDHPDLTIIADSWEWLEERGIVKFYDNKDESIAAFDIDSIIGLFKVPEEVVGSPWLSEQDRMEIMSNTLAHELNGLALDASCE